MRAQQKLLPKPPTDSKSIVITSQDTGKAVATLLKRVTHLSKQAQMLADLLGGVRVTRQMTSVVLLSGSGEHSNERASSLEGIQVQARVLYIDFVQSQQAGFKLTTDTIDTLEKHRRALCHVRSEAHSRGNVKMGEDVKILMGNFDRAIDHLVHHADTCCLDEMNKDGSGELTTQQSANVKSTILELFGPYERYLDTFQELLSSRLDGLLSEASAFEF